MLDRTKSDDVALIVFSDDWGRHPSSCQHLIRHLLKHHRVLWINTIGTRPPAFDSYTLWRALGKFRDWRHGNADCNNWPCNLRVAAPWMWPWMGHRWNRRLNRLLLKTQVTRMLREVSGPPIVLTTVPIIADLMGEIPAARWVYYCVDDLSCWPSLANSTLAAMEEELIQSVDELIVASEFLQDRFLARGRSSVLLSHGIELNDWRNPVSKALPSSIVAAERPWIVFWGLIDERLDADFLLSLAAALRQGTIVLVGPKVHLDSRIARCPNVLWVDALPYHDLPQLGCEAAVLIMPYLDAPVTHAMQPLKLKEYLATDRPAVVRDLPAVRTWTDCLDAVRTPDEFTSAVMNRIANGLPAGHRIARRRVASEDWESKASHFRQLIFRLEQPQDVVAELSSQPLEDLN